MDKSGLQCYYVHCYSLSLSLSLSAHPRTTQSSLVLVLCLAQKWGGGGGKSPSTSIPSSCFTVDEQASIIQSQRSTPMDKHQRVPKPRAAQSTSVWCRIPELHGRQASIISRDSHNEELHRSVFSHSFHLYSPKT